MNNVTLSVSRFTESFGTIYYFTTYYASALYQTTDHFLDWSVFFSSCLQTYTTFSPCCISPVALMRSSPAVGGR